MRVLVIGASGLVGTLTVPALAASHTLRLFDLRPPEDTSLEFLAGDVTDYKTLTKAVEGMDALVYMAMGSIDWDEIPGLESAFDVNVKGLYFALRAAAAAGITLAVYTSTMSVYSGVGQNPDKDRYFSDEALPPDATDLYGFTKRLGEEVCLNASRTWNMDVNALRLCHPTPTQRWLAETEPGVPTINTTGEDVARAVLSALEFRGGFQAFTISGDYEYRLMNMSKAERLLGWEPLARPKAD
ncbi:MAG: NAD(P)-dependent oxidoreductase [Trueperaceae bacterium]|nr:MAG: NAD(P)-dependent oxidoreductase [Trueperaceae bacterium]